MYTLACVFVRKQLTNNADSPHIWLQLWHDRVRREKLFMTIMAGLPLQCVCVVVHRTNDGQLSEFSWHTERRV